MPALRDVKQQLREWERSHARVILLFRAFGFNLLLDGRVHCDSHGRDFEFVTEAGALASPRLRAFHVVALGPDPKWHNHIAIQLRHRRRRIEMTLIERGAAEPTLEELQAVAGAFKQSKEKSYVQ
jgi:hypothetical protein